MSLFFLAPLQYSSNPLPINATAQNTSFPSKEAISTQQSAISNPRHAPRLAGAGGTGQPNPHRTRLEIRTRIDCGDSNISLLPGPSPVQDQANPDGKHSAADDLQFKNQLVLHLPRGDNREDN